MHEITTLLIEAELAAGRGGSVAIYVGNYGHNRNPAPYVLAYTDRPRPECGAWGTPGICVSRPYGSKESTRVALFTDDPHTDVETMLAEMIGFLTAPTIRETVVL